MSQETCIWD